MGGPYLPCSGTLSDASRVARLGGGNLTAAQQQLQERQAAGAHASTSGQDEAGWGDRGVGGQVLGSMRGPGASGSGQIELPSMPWSDWEVPAEQITICKREDGSDWELGSGAFGKVCLTPLHVPCSCVLCTVCSLWLLCPPVSSPHTSMASLVCLGPWRPASAALQGVPGNEDVSGT